MRNTPTIPNANMEQGARNAPNGTKTIKRLDTQCCIHCHSLRHRATDADGICYKYAIDGLIHAGLLPNDSPTFVKEVSFSQEKIKKAELEETIITITW